MLRSKSLVASVLGIVVAVWAGSAMADVVITASGDPTYAIYDTVAGGNSTASQPGLDTGNYYSNAPWVFAASNAIDGDVATKYLNFGYGAEGVAYANKAINTGFYVTPSMGGTRLTGFKFTTANDYEERDPLSVTIEGSNATGSALTVGNNWSLIYSGVSGLASTTGRYTEGALESISTTNAYLSYRILVTGQRNALANGTAADPNCMQFGELALFGVSAPVPEPSAMLLTATAILGLLAYASRKRT